MKAAADWRKVVLILLVFSTVFLSQATLGAENYKAGDKLYVAPTSGIQLRAFPAKTAPILAGLSFNQVVTIIQDSLPVTPFQVAVSNFNSGKLNLQGHWVKVKTGDKTGYVFDGMLSKIKGLELGSFEEDPYYASIFGAPTLKTVQKSKVIEGRKYDYEIKSTTYPRSLAIESTFFDDCVTLLYTYSLSFNEAYWLIERLLKDADAAQEVKINKAKDKTILEFYSCT